jgi:hypothetical protein
MAATPPQNDDPSSRFSFDDPAPGQASFGANVPAQNQQRHNPYAHGYREEPDSFKDVVLDEVDDALGITNRLLGCSWWLLTLPFRLIWKVIEAVTD